MIYAKKLKKKCMIRGCGNVESFALSKSLSDIGNVFICASCLAEGLSQVDEARKNFDEAKAEKAKKSSAPPALFYHPAAVTVITEPSAESEVIGESVDGTVDDMVDEVVDEAENSVDGEVHEEAVNESMADESTEFICAECGKAFSSLRGLNVHAKVHEN